MPTVSLHLADQQMVVPLGFYHKSYAEMCFSNEHIFTHLQSMCKLLGQIDDDVIL